mmetsp:Transcript_13407/g.25169  ORF Transcript_13407/g.25169 Transcript_13407/m.25169 type:complete len:112 (+) Transcript_13407:282-617(+)
MCLSPLVVMLWLHLTAASLSFCIGMGALSVNSWNRWSGPPNHIRKPEMDRDLKRSSSMGESFGLGVEACGPQLASENGWSLSGAMGNLTKDSNDGLTWLLKVIPRLEVPFK